MNIEKIPSALTGTMGTMDVVVDGVMYHDVPCRLVMVTDSTERDTAITDPTPGLFAATYGLGTIWQYDGSDWVEV